MWRPQLPTLLDANGNSGFTSDIGLIFFLNRRDNRTFLGHGGRPEWLHKLYRLRSGDKAGIGYRVQH
jgi:hypothetical protein